MFTYKITDLTFSGGQKIEIGDADVVILVGANNCGKSQSLKDIALHLHIGTANNINRTSVIRDINIVSEGDSHAVATWLGNSYYQDTQERFHIPTNWGTSNTSYHHIDIKQIEYALSTNSLSSRLHNALSRKFDTNSRLHEANNAPRFDLHQAPPKSFINLLQLDEQKLKAISTEVKAAFGKELIINWSGTAIQLHFGIEPQRTLENDRISPKYIKELNQQPILMFEGDGVRSFIGMLLTFMLGTHKIILLDEPELFLHPPQAKRLGKLVGESTKLHAQQLVIATHSSEIIQGILAGTDKVAIIRINREDNLNNSYLIGSEELKDLWQKPLLRSSDAIRGLFHQGVVICESDADERFYEGLMLRLDRQGKFTQPADFYFVQGGGKGELATLAKSYRALHIPTAVIADFDILQNKKEFQKLYEVLGGNFGEIEKLYNSVGSALANLGSSKSKMDVIEEIRKFADELDSKEEITGSDKEKISKLFDEGRLWSEAKKYGKVKLSGGKYNDCENLLSQAAKMGLFIVPTGELESWDKSLPANKNEWILAALEKLDAEAKSFADASSFMVNIGIYLGLEQK